MAKFILSRPAKPLEILRVVNALEAFLSLVSDGALRDDSRNGPDRSCPLDETAVDNDWTAFLGLHGDANLHRGLGDFATSAPNRQLGIVLRMAPWDARPAVGGLF